MFRYLQMALTIAILAGVASFPALAAKKKSRGASDTGLATSLHEVVQTGRRLCMVSHAHDGKGVHRRKSSAMRAAQRDWSSFTIDEYGTAWGRLSRSVGREKSCSKFDGLWTCYINARPCRVSVPKKKRRVRRKRK